MNTDHYFVIGSQHKVCQDYCLSGFNKGISYAILSDGCSGSVDTDFGARILAKTAEKIIHLLPEDFFKIQVISVAADMLNTLSLPKESLDATLLAAITDGTNYHIKAYGDGVIAKVMEDNSVEISIIEFKSGAPYYLNYLINPNRHYAYIDQFGTQRRVYKYNNNFLLCTEETFSTCEYVEIGDCKGLKSIVLISDGALSFMEIVNNDAKIYEGIEPSEIIKELTGFKNIKGEFVQRRMKSFLKYCAKEEIKHTDDLSVAAISLM